MNRGAFFSFRVHGAYGRDTAMVLCDRVNIFSNLVSCLLVPEIGRKPSRILKARIPNMVMKTRQTLDF